MSTNDTNNPTPGFSTPPATSESPAQQGTGQAIVDLVQTLQSVQPPTADAAANATSISDNNGGRINLNDEPTTIKEVDS